MVPIVRDIRPPALSAGRKTGKTLVMEDTGAPQGIKRLREASIILFAGCLILGIFTFLQLGKKGLRFQHSLVTGASAGFEKILEGASALKDSRFENAKNLFEQASSAFADLEGQTGWALRREGASGFALHDPLQDAGMALLAAGKHLGTAGATFSETIGRLKLLPGQMFEANNRALGLPPGLPSLTENLKKQLPSILGAAEELQKAHGEIQKISDRLVPAQLREKFRFAVNALAALAGIVEDLTKDLPSLLGLLGDQQPHTYLILLQNNAELRPSGGFIGNYMIVETNDGYVTKTEVFDIYAADHQLTEEIPAPPEIAPANPRWFMRDSNYSGHFPLSAAKAAWFLEKENGPGVDSVIAVDQTLVEELLNLTGPIRIAQLPQPLASENFSAVTSYAVESKLSGREDPKALLKSFMPVFQQALFKYADPLALAPLLKNAAESKHLLAYSKDPELQAFWQRRGLSGELKTPAAKEDYLAVIHTSVSGNKSDAFVAETLTHDTYLNSDGSVLDQLAITRAHLWTKETTARLKNILSGFGFPADIDPKLLAILGRATNAHMLRIYVPAGSTLEDSSDPALEQKFDGETGKTYFSSRMDVPLNDSRTLTVRYRLPFKLNLDPVDAYSFTIQKQAGQQRATLIKRIFPASRIANYQYFPQSGNFDLDGVLNFEAPLEKDLSFSSIWGK